MGHHQLPLISPHRSGDLKGTPPKELGLSGLIADRAVWYLLIPTLRCWLPHHLCSTGVLPSFSYIQELVSPLASASFSGGGEEISDTGDDWLQCYGFELLLTINNLVRKSIW